MVFHERWSLNSGVSDDRFYCSQSTTPSSNHLTGSPQKFPKLEPIPISDQSVVDTNCTKLVQLSNNVTILSSRQPIHKVTQLVKWMFCRLDREIVTTSIHPPALRTSRPRPLELRLQWRIQDFPLRGRGRRVPTRVLFSGNTCENEKNWVLWGGGGEGESAKELCSSSPTNYNNL